MVSDYFQWPPQFGLAGLARAWRRFSLHEGVTDETTIVCVPWAIHRLLSLYEVRLPSVGLVKQGRFHKIACYWLLAVRTMEREKGSTSRWREWGCVTKLDMRSGHRRHASTSLRERGPSGRRSSTSLVQWCNSAVVLWCCGALVLWMGWCSIRKRSTQPQTSPFNWWIDEAGDDRRARSRRPASLCPKP